MLIYDHIIRWQNLKNSLKSQKIHLRCDPSSYHCRPYNISELHFLVWGYYWVTLGQHGLWSLFFWIQARSGPGSGHWLDSWFSWTGVRVDGAALGVSAHVRLGIWSSSHLVMRIWFQNYHRHGQGHCFMALHLIIWSWGCARICKKNILRA